MDEAHFEHLNAEPKSTGIVALSGMDNMPSKMLADEPVCCPTVCVDGVGTSKPIITVVYGSKHESIYEVEYDGRGLADKAWDSDLS